MVSCGPLKSPADQILWAHRRPPPVSIHYLRGGLIIVLFMLFYCVVNLHCSKCFKNTFTKYITQIHTVATKCAPCKPHGAQDSHEKSIHQVSGLKSSFQPRSVIVIINVFALIALKRILVWFLTNSWIQTFFSQTYEHNHLNLFNCNKLNSLKFWIAGLKYSG